MIMCNECGIKQVNSHEITFSALECTENFVRF